MSANDELLLHLLHSRTENENIQDILIMGILPLKQGLNKPTQMCTA
jgi:hypothetical protein